MKNITRRLIPLLLCLILCFSVFSVSALAAGVEVSQNSSGNWVAKNNGTVVQNGWVEYNDGWFYARNSVLVTGWQQIDGKWYYFEATSGSRPYMYKNTMLVDGEVHSWDEYLKTPVYYFTADGSLYSGPTGWRSYLWNNRGTLINTYIYVYSDGTVHHGWLNDNGSWYMLTSIMNKNSFFQAEENSPLYYFGSDGKMVTNNWVKMGQYQDSSTVWGYAQGDGTFATGWKQIDGKWYYFTEYHNAYPGGTYTIDGKEYKFDENGAWIEDGGSSSADLHGWIQRGGGAWLYYGSDGKFVTGWQQIDGNWYFFDKTSGVMAADQIIEGCYVDANGVMKTGWVQIGADWYYFGGDGAMKTGWQQIDGNWYYFYDSGKMAVNTTVEGYTLNADGVCVS